MNNLPFGSEFSPSQIELPKLLVICYENSGDKASLESEILHAFFEKHGRESAENRKKLAMNCRLGLKAYGIIGDNCEFTDFGKELYEIRDNESFLYMKLARHILTNLNGMSFIQCIKDMNASLESITLEKLHIACRERGLNYPSGGKHPSIMRLWLHKAGVFTGNRWEIDEERLKEILGTTVSMDALRDLTALQRAFLKSLINTGKSSPQPANRIAKLAEVTFNLRFPEKTLPHDVLAGLVSAGFITSEKATAGRGSKPFLVAPTDKAREEVLLPFLKQLESQTDPKLFELYRKSLAEIVSELDSEDRYISGLALEALAFKLMRILDMDYVATRLRGEKTGGAEVDLIFESTRLVYSRWQIQCKNTSRVSLDDVAKEVGLTHLLKSNVIVMVTTGTIGTEAHRYANTIMKNSNICIVMIDGADIKRIIADPSSIINSFEREAKSAKALKKLDMENHSDES